MHTQPGSPVIPNLFQSSHSRWVALTHRAPSSHSSFLYGVKSTKIYCRPTCPARLARRANVVFYDTEDQARRDGFRPCRRCKPDKAGFVGEREEVVTRTIALLRIKKDELTMKRGLKELAKEVGVTPSYLCRVFKKTMGVTVRAYMMEFEREGSEDETESSVQSPNELGSDLAEVATGPLTSEIPARSRLPMPVDSLKGGLEEQNVGDVKEALDFNFNLDEWIWTENFLNDSIYECTT
ncbi:metal binding domain of Ada-domain-containing protein [Aspergillus lucknowensis]|uniref:Metal binding domain of Ada-domain-containing protein n=1 Tax=Aspergillus lucknowensis TaxID=176173 RepID=A0ABR4LK95_9EURO